MSSCLDITNFLCGPFIIQSKSPHGKSLFKFFINNRHQNNLNHIIGAQVMTDFISLALVHSTNNLF